jgi:enoyl-CoA hydratase
LLGAFAEPPGQGMVNRAAIDRLFAGARIEDILARLDAETGSDGAWATATAATIRTKSPTSLKLALAQVRRGRDWSFEECMVHEFRIVSRIVYGHDFYEGVRAVIVDKDNAPRWKPAALGEIHDAEIERHFATLGADELVLP